MSEAQRSGEADVGGPFPEVGGPLVEGCRAVSVQGRTPDKTRTRVIYVQHLDVNPGGRTVAQYPLDYTAPAEIPDRHRKTGKVSRNRLTRSCKLCPHEEHSIRTAQDENIQVLCIVVRGATL